LPGSVLNSGRAASTVMVAVAMARAVRSWFFLNPAVRTIGAFIAARSFFIALSSSSSLRST
jgi:hypothetical protein